MKSNHTKQPLKKSNQEECDRQVRLIQTLAVRLPWIVVTVSLFAVIYFIVEAYLSGGA